jgi:uncharacterized delta-60 repeat protein
VLSLRPSRRRLAVAGFAAAAIALGAVVTAVALGLASDDAPQPAGALDESFGEAGIVRAAAMAVEPATFIRLEDGRIVAVGSAGRGRRTFELVAYRPDGSLDESFGRNGVVRTRIGTYAVAKAAAARPDGGFVVAGCASSVPRAHDCGDKLALAAYLPDGALDRSFGDRGVVTTSFPRAFPEALALALQPDGRMVAAGGLFGDLAPRDSHFAVSETAILVVRHRAEGSLDPSFGRQGVVLVRVPGPRGIPVAASEVALQADGRILLGESAVFTKRADGFRVIRLRDDGTLDPTFGVGGRTQATLSTTSPCCSALGALVPLPDGRIVAAGQDSEAKRRAALVRFTATGTLDRSFGDDGIVFAGRQQDAWVHAADVFPLEQGQILAVGWANVGPRPSPRAHYLLLRLTESGALDRSFGQDGRVATPTGVPATAAFLERPWLVVAGADDIDAGEVVFARYHIP